MHESNKTLPSEFLKWAFYERRELIEKMLAGKLTERDTSVGFLRHTPAIVTVGPAGLNASIKGIGFVPKKEFLEDVVSQLKSAMKRKRTMRESVEVLLNVVYNDKKLDFTKLSTIELAKHHTWANLQKSSDATILFYMPPETTYELRCKATIHTNDLYWEYVNAIHDVFHMTPVPHKKRDWSKTPVYIFEINEIYDNNPKFMGKRIF